ncbi:MAG: Asp-tRNA(Asn)/Glu-tRNA(Gln) amidotransferase subunit GatB [Anaerolineales bacterium]
MTSYEPVIGLEVHAELLTRTKMFCDSPVVDTTSALPNTAVCPVCLGLPGTLPVINRRAVELGLRVALALGCEVPSFSVFARKNYFYPDLPKGYQISQFELPLAIGGRLPLRTEGGTKSVRVQRVHLEEDTGKLFHVEAARPYSLVDFNRAGVPLLEVVSEPDLHSVEEVKAYAIELRRLLCYLEVSSGDMDKGAIRLEANVSLRPMGQQELGTRVEIKNLNSFRALAHSVEYEIQRQQDVLEKGGVIRQETLGWDESAGATVIQRSKEEAHDYRYFPEPDLPPLEVDRAWLDRIAASVPELPHARLERLAGQYGLSLSEADRITAEKAIADYFESAVAAARVARPKMVAAWLVGDLFGLLNAKGKVLVRPEGQPEIAPDELASLVDLVASGTVSAPTAKSLLEAMLDTGKSARGLVEEGGLAQIDDAAALEGLIARVLSDHAEQVELYRTGKRTVLEWLLGQVMKASQGRANPSRVRSLLEEQLSSATPKG